MNLGFKFMSFDDMYEWLISTGDINCIEYCLDSDGVWKRLPLKWMLEHFQNQEEYEKCAILKPFIEKYFIADNKTQDRLNIYQDGLDNLY